MPLISFVVPCYNEQDSLPLFCEELAQAVETMNDTYDDLRYEALFVDDGSHDSTLDIIEHLAQDDLPFTVRWIAFSRNFGKEAALYAGLSHARGDYVATMDADMQDPPSLIPQMYALLLEKDCDNVATRRYNRKGEPRVRSFFARRFYHLINRISDTEIVNGARDFRLMRRRMVDAILSVGEYNRFSKGIFSWVGFKTEWISYENTERAAGTSRWNFWSLFKYAVEGIVGYSTLPLTVAAFVGSIVSLIAIVFLVVVVVRALLFGDPVSGWPSLMSVILLLGGLQILFLGVLGQYLAKTYLETKHRPLYVIRESSDDADAQQTG
ncbi:MAG: glycosyltransferase family 2 protein [Actinomycetota bacterium]|nr:glycosyltransferase family 2 protein [Actinomycetota bacterium]